MAQPESPAPNLVACLTAEHSIGAVRGPSEVRIKRMQVGKIGHALVGIVGIKCEWILQRELAIQTQLQLSHQSIYATPRDVSMLPRCAVALPAWEQAGSQAFDL